MSQNKWLSKYSPILWSIAIFIVAQALTLVTVWRENAFLNEEEIYVPTQPAEVISVWPGTVTQSDGTTVEVPAYSALGPILIYFVVTIAIIGLVLYFMPMSLLRKFMRVIFAFLFGWGIFVALGIWVPLWVSISVSLAAGLAWLLFPRV
jgi:hypothetical protein